MIESDVDEYIRAKVKKLDKWSGQQLSVINFKTQLVEVNGMSEKKECL